MSRNLKRPALASVLAAGTLAATAGVASANNSKFGPNFFGAGNSPTCQPGNGFGDQNVNHFHTGPPGQPGNPSAQQIHNADLQNNNFVPGGPNGRCAAQPTPPTPPPTPPKPPKPPGPPVVPHGPVTPSAAVTPQHVAVTPQAAVQQHVVQQQVTTAPAAAPVQTTAHFTG